MKKLLTTLKLKWTEYLLEILVIMIGILGAYALNNWNENRKERIQETAILLQLQTEFKSNLTQLDERIEIRRLMINSAVRLLENIDRPQQRNKDSIDHHIAWTIPYTTFDPIVNDLSSSGNLRIIKSDSLKQLLSFWTSEIVQVTEGEGSWTKYRNEVYVPFLIENYQFRTLRNKSMKTNLMKAFLINQEERSSTYRIVDIGETKHEEDFNHLLSLPDYEDHLVRCIVMNRNTQHQAYILRERIVGILELLESELSNQ